jgi:hypothetical protein
LFFRYAVDSGRAKGVVADPCLDAGDLGAPLNHSVGVLLLHSAAGKRAGLTGRRPEQRPVRTSGNASGRDVFMEVLFQIVVAGHLVLLTPFFMEPYPFRGGPARNNPSPFI